MEGSITTPLQSRMMNIQQLHEKYGKELRIPRAFWLEEARAKRLPCVLVGSRVLFNVDEVEKNLAERASKPANVPPKKVRKRVAPQEQQSLSAIG